MARPSDVFRKQDRQNTAVCLPGGKYGPEHRREFNILLLGETEVGKSTWINGFANYMTHSSLEAAEIHGLFPVPLKFELMLDYDTSQEITAGTADKNEDDTVEESSTQSSNSYLFPTDNVVIRLIDTPGVGDTRGYDQDKKNFENTLRHIAQLNELHGIVILLKPNNARINVMFESCIKELLTNLHKSASNNIVFCFLHSRGTM